MTSDTTSALDNTRKLASQAMERANETVRDLRSSMQEATARGMGAMSERASAARGYLGDYATAGRRYVGEHPLKTALIAAAVGAAVAGIFIALRHQRDRDSF